MLPKCLDEWHSNTKRPSSRNREDILEQFKRYLSQGISQEFLDSRIITTNEAIEVLKQLNIKENTSFYEFYKTL